MPETITRNTQNEKGDRTSKKPQGKNTIHKGKKLNHIQYPEKKKVNTLDTLEKIYSQDPDAFKAFMKKHIKDILEEKEKEEKDLLEEVEEDEKEKDKKLEDARAKLEEVLHAPSVVPAQPKVAPAAPVETTPAPTPFDHDKRYKNPSTEEVQTSFEAPKNEHETALKQMLEDRVSMLADEQMKALPIENMKKAPWYKKPFAYAGGVLKNLTSASAYNDAKNKILYENGISGKLSAQAQELYKQLHESMHYAELSEGTDKELHASLKATALKNAGKKPKTGFMKKFFDTGFGRNLSDRFGLNGSMKVTQNHPGAELALKGTTAVGFATAALVGGARKIFGAIPLVGSGIAAGIFGAVAENKKHKSLKAFVEDHLSKTAFAGISRFPTLDEVKERLKKSENPYFQLRFTEELLNRAFAAGRQDRAAGMVGFATLRSHISLLKKEFDKAINSGNAELKASLLNGWNEDQMKLHAESTEKAINKMNRNKNIKTALIAGVLGAGAAGIIMQTGAYLSSSPASPSTHLESIRQNAIRTTNHSYINHSVSTQTNVESYAIPNNSATIANEYIDGKVKFGNTEYVVLKGNDNANNYPIYALADGRIPYRVIVDEPNAKITPEFLANNTRKLHMNVGGVNVHPVADFTNQYDSPIEVHFVSYDTIMKKFNGEATTYFRNGKRVVYCTPEYANEELFHAAMGISKEPYEHLSKTIAGSQGDITDGEQMLLNEKQHAVLTTTNQNAQQIGGTDIRFASPIAQTPDLSSTVAAKQQYIVNLYNNLKTERAGLGSSTATKAALDLAKNDLEQYAKVHVSPDELDTAWQYYKEVQYGSDGFAKFFGSAGSHVYERTQVGGYMKGLVSDGFQAENFNDYDNAMIGLESNFRGNGEYFFNRYTSMLEADPSPKAKEMLFEAYKEKLSDVKKMNYFLKVGEEAVNKNNNGILPDFHPATEENVQMYENDILAEEFRIKNKLINIQNDIKVAYANQRQLNDTVRNLTQKYQTEVQAEQTYDAHLKKFNDEQALFLNYKKQLSALQTDSSAAKAPTLDTTVDTTSASGNTSNPNVNTQQDTGSAPKGTAVDPLEELERMQTKPAATNSSSMHSPVSKNAVDELNQSPSKNTNTQHPYFLTEENEETSLPSLKEVLDSMDNTANGQQMINGIINQYFPDQYYPTVEAKADGMIKYLNRYVNHMNLHGSKFTTAFSPYDSQEIGNVKVGDYKISEILTNARLRSKLAQAIIDSPTNGTVAGENGGIILSDREMEAFAYNPDAHWAWTPEWLARHPYLGSAGILGVVAILAYAGYKVKGLFKKPATGTTSSTGTGSGGSGSGSGGAGSGAGTGTGGSGSGASTGTGAGAGGTGTTP